VYDPEDPTFDPSGTYVAPEVIQTEEVNEDSGLENAAEVVEDDGLGDSKETEWLDNEETDVYSQASNDETGAFSDNNAETEINNKNETEIDNEADIENDVQAQANSGENDADMNTGDGIIDSGDADLASNIIAAANNVISGSSSFALPIINILSDLVGDLILDSDQYFGDSSDLNLEQIVSNFLTGYGSSNNATASLNNENITEINNDGNLNNGLNLAANSGDNSASMNTGDGVINTGDANIASNVVNFLNNTIFASNWWMGIVNIFGDWNGNLIAPSMSGVGETGIVNQSAGNVGTGAYSDNYAAGIFDNNSQTNIDNNAGIIDNVNIDTNTGANEAIGNTGNGLISTGDSHIKDNQLTIANNTIVGGSWWMMLVNTLDGWAGAIIGSPFGGVQFLPFLFGSAASNVETGPYSDNSAVSEVDINNTTDISNEAQTENTLNLSANTGRNQTNYNTGSGEISTGDANIMSNLVNFVNNTFNVQNWAFGIINVFGKWTGGVKFGADAVSDPSTDVSASSIMSTAENLQTGFGSDNDVANIVDYDEEISIDNDLAVAKNLNIHANTGDNEVKFNTGFGAIDTGDIYSQSSLATFGNITEIGLPGLLGEAVFADNVWTGPYSQNGIFSAIYKNVCIKIDNSVDFVKNVTAWLNTGNNDADGNTGGSKIETGDIDFVLREKEIFNIVRISLGEAAEEEEIAPNEQFEEDVPYEVLDFGEELPLAGADFGISILIALIATLAFRRKYFTS
jgi:hypothetical protein